VTYIVHREEKPVRRHIPAYVPAEVQKTENADEYALICQNQPVKLAADTATRNTVIGWVTAKKGEKPADCDFAYGTVTEDGNMLMPGWKGEKLYVITNRGTIYEIG
jgi:hypothetical protein